ncbi:MAG: hypothetical protein IJP62_06700 [Treponema sp.]|nr:hypothetical protein [Treponema sp.]
MTFQEKEMLDNICEPCERSAEIGKEFKTEPTEVQTRIKNAILVLWDEFLKERGDEVSNFCTVVDLMTEYFLATEDDETPTPFWAMGNEDFVRIKTYTFHFLRQVAKLSILFENDWEEQNKAKRTARQDAPSASAFAKIMDANAKKIEELAQENETLKIRLAKAEKNDK